MSGRATSMQRPAGRALAPRVQLLAAAALFSTGGAVIKAIHLSGWPVACLRSGIAAAALLLVLPQARRRPGPRVLAVAASYAVTMILFVLANKLTTAASTIFLQSTAPLYVLLLGPWLLRERIRREDLLSMAAIGLGLALLVAGLEPASATAPEPLRGDLLAALSGLTWGLTIMGLRGLGRRGESAGVPGGAAAARTDEAAARTGGAAPGGGEAAAAAFWGNVLACAAALPLSLPLPPAGAADWLGNSSRPSTVAQGTGCRGRSSKCRGATCDRSTLANSGSEVRSRSTLTSTNEPRTKCPSRARTSISGRASSPCDVMSRSRSLVFRPSMYFSIATPPATAYSTRRSARSSNSRATAGLKSSATPMRPPGQSLGSKAQAS